MKVFSKAIWDGDYTYLYGEGVECVSVNALALLNHGYLKPDIASVIALAKKQGFEPLGDVALEIRYKPLNKRNVSRKEINDALCRLERVSGTYYGVPYSGEVTGNRGITVRPYDIEIYVKLDKPITVFSQERDTVTINGGKVYEDLYLSNTKGLTTINELWE